MLFFGSLLCSLIWVQYFFDNCEQALFIEFSLFFICFEFFIEIDIFIFSLEEVLFLVYLNVSNCVNLDVVIVNGDIWVMFLFKGNILILMFFGIDQFYMVLFWGIFCEQLIFIGCVLGVIEVILQASVSLNEVYYFLIVGGVGFV